MRNLLMTLVLCGVAHWASAAAECPAPAVARPESRPPAELISSAAAQPPLAVPAVARASTTQVLGGPPASATGEQPRRGSRLAMVLAAVGVMLVIVVRRMGASA